MPPASLPRNRLALFATPAFTIAALGLPISVFLPPLYAEVGVSLTMVGTLFMITRLFDVVTDPLVGTLGDRVRTRWGRRRPALIVSVPLLAGGVYLAFFPGPDGASAWRLLASMLILYAGWTVFAITHTAWAGELSSDYDERSRIMGMLQLFGLIGMVMVAALPTFLETVSTQTTMRERAGLMGMLVLITLPVFAVLAVSAVPEPRVRPTPRIPWRQGLATLIGNRALRRLLLADLLVGIQGGINGSVHFFFIALVLAMPQSASLYLVVLFASGLLFVPAFVRLSYRLGKHRTLCTGTLISAVGTAMLFFIPAGGFWLTMVAYVLIGVNHGVRELLMRSIMADVVDLDRVDAGAERSALYYSTLTLTAKLGSAVAVGVIFPVLDWVGFDPTAQNDPATIEGVRLVVAATPTIVLLAVTAIMWRFPIDKTAQQALRAQLAVRDGEGV